MNELLKTFVMVAVFGGIFSTAATAVAEQHGNHGRGHHAHMRLAMLDRIVDLTDEQKAELKALFENRVKSREHCKAGQHAAIHTLDATAEDYSQQLALIADDAASCAREKVLLRGELHASVQSILTEPQRLELAEFQLQKREKRALRKERHRNF